MGGAFKIGRFSGIDVRVHTSLHILRFTLVAADRGGLLDLWCAQCRNIGR